MYLWTARRLQVDFLTTFYPPNSGSVTQLNSISKYYINKKLKLDGKPVGEILRLGAARRTHAQTDEQDGNVMPLRPIGCARRGIKVTEKMQRFVSIAK